MKFFFTIALVFGGMNLLHAQGTGKVHGKIFSNFNYNATDEAAAFEISRAYFGYKYKYNDAWSLKVTFDVGGKENETYYARTAFLKVAALKWKATDKLTINFGQVGLKQFKAQEKNWGYRYIAKSSQDEYKMGTSADMGFTADYKLNGMLAVDLTVVNGEGYKKDQADSNLKTGFGLTMKATDALTLRVYTDALAKSDTSTQNTVALFAGYKADAFRLGAEYNTQTGHKNTEGNDFEIASAYGTYYVNYQVGVFARYDIVSSDEGWDNDKDGDYLIAGLEYRPVKGVSVSVNVQGYTPESGDAENSFYMNLQYKF